MKSVQQFVFIVAILSLGACTGINNWGLGQKTRTKEQLIQDLDHINSHLLLMREITAADYQQQLGLFESIYKQRQAQGDARATLRYALVLTTAGHPNTNIGRGYTELAQVIETPGALTAAELNLATVVMQEAADQMILHTRNTELNSMVSDTQNEISKSGRSSRVSLQEAKNRLTEAQLEIDALRTELAEARAKLDAIKNIEVSSE